MKGDFGCHKPQPNLPFCVFVLSFLLVQSKPCMVLSLALQVRDFRTLLEVLAAHSQPLLLLP